VVAIPYLPVEPKPWRLRMGLRPLDLDRWLEVDQLRALELAQKHVLLDNTDTRQRVLGWVDGEDGDAATLLELILAHLDKRHPGLVTPTSAGSLRDNSTGRLIDPDELHPIEAAARLVQEDLCLMAKRGADWVLGAACVCFPSRWSLLEKIGRNLAGIHGPVPGYESELAAPTQAFFDRLSPDRPVWRLNWTLLTDPVLYQPDPSERAGRPISDPGTEVWFRVERQTLRRISSMTIAFTIRTYVNSLGELLACHPEAGPAVASALSDLPPGVPEYKGWLELGPLIQRWLGSSSRQ
jgi:hypothetical protein